MISCQAICILLFCHAIAINYKKEVNSIMLTVLKGPDSIHQTAELTATLSNQSAMRFWRAGLYRSGVKSNAVPRLK